ncbi:WD40 repeat domain-containing protein [Streptomyces sp. PvR034]|uniref:WD40 repeat domain-containing protein n=1 Tax=Streptomyces sp. PvR034 TaxID=3156401 RepID=UPI0033909290
MDPQSTFDEELEAFAAGLRALRLERGKRSYRELAARAARSGTAIRLPVATQSDAFRGRRMLGFDTLMGLVRILYSYDTYGQEIAVPPHSAPELEQWRRDWRALAARQPATPRGPKATPAPDPGGREAPSAEALFTPVHRLPEHPDTTWSAAFSADGRLVATTCEDERVRLWNTATGKEWGEPLPGTFPVVFTPEGRILVVDAESRSAVRPYDVATLLRDGPGLTGGVPPIRAMVHEPDSGAVALLGFDGGVRLWDPAIGDHGVPFPPGPDGPCALTRTVDGHLLAAGPGGEVWDLLQGRPRVQAPLVPPLDGAGVMALSPDGRTVAFGRPDGSAGLLGTRPGGPVRPLRGHRDTVNALAFSPDSRLLASSSADGTLRLWDTRTGLPAAPPLTEHSGAVNGVAFSPDGRLLASASDDRTVVLYERVATAPASTLASRALTTALRARRPVQLPPLHVGGSAIRTAFSPFGHQVLATTTSEQSVVLWDPVSGQALGPPLTDPPTLPWALTFSPDGALLATASAGGTLCLRDPLLPMSFRTIGTGHTDKVERIAFSPDGQLMATAGRDATVRLWDPATGHPFGAPLTEHTNEVVGLAFSPDGVHLASSDANGQVILWSGHRRTPVRRFEGVGPGAAWSVAFSPDGTRLAAALADGSVRLWDPLTGQPLGGSATSHTGPAYDVAFSPDGDLLASAGKDGAVLLRDPATGARLGHPLTGHTGAVNGLAFSPDGSLLATAGRDGTLRRWIVGAG